MMKKFKFDNLYYYIKNNNTTIELDRLLPSHTDRIDATIIDALLIRI